MELFELLSKWFWIVFILITFLNGAVYQFQGRKRIKQNPELEEGYKKILKGFVTWGNLPWMIMGIGIIIGGVPSVFHFFNPKEGNPYVLSFFASIILLWILGTIWILFRGGARALVDHPGLLNYDLKNTFIVKTIWIVGVLGGIIAFAIIYTQDIPLPTF